MAGNWRLGTVRLAFPRRPGPKQIFGRGDAHRKGFQMRFTNPHRNSKTHVSITLVTALVAAAFLFSACSGGGDTQTSQKTPPRKSTSTASANKKAAQAYADKSGETTKTETATSGGDKGVGPITSIDLKPIDPALVAKGQTIFDSKCAACHKFEERYVGPALAGVTERRAPEWIMNMMLNPTEMVQKNEAARALLAEYAVPMTFQNVSEEDAEAILTYFRSVDANAQ